MSVVAKGRLRVTPALRTTLTPSERRLIRMFIAACEDTTNRIDRPRLQQAIEHGPPDTAIAAVDLTPITNMTGPWADELTVEALDAGTRTANSLVRKQVIVDIAFNRQRPEARRWAQQHAASLIKGIRDQQRQVIRAWIADSMTGQYTVYDIMNMVEDTVGLTPAQLQWVRNFRARALAQQPVKRPAALAREDAMRRTRAYAARIRRYRAETIARTEVMRALSEGRSLAWQQQIDNGLLSATTLKMWVSQRDGNVCDRCIELDGTLVRVVEQFPFGDPPLHPNCRCTVILQPDLGVDQYGAPDLSSLSDEQLRAELARLLEGELPVVQTPVTEGEALADLVERTLGAAPRVTGNQVTDALRNARGFSTSPVDVSGATFSRLLDDGQQVWYQLPVGDSLADEAFGGGVFGRGLYMTLNRSRFMRWVREEFPNLRQRNEQLHRLHNLTLHPYARIIEWPTLYADWEALRKIDDPRDQYDDPIQLAIARGYDAIRFVTPAGETVLNILNGRAVVRRR